MVDSRAENVSDTMLALGCCQPGWHLMREASMMKRAAILSAWPVNQAWSIHQHVCACMRVSLCRLASPQTPCTPHHPQVVQQQQQLQMSFAWSFLHVGQSMTANLFHSTAPGGGPQAARLLSQRIISWALTSCVMLACGTYMMRCVRACVHNAQSRRPWFDHVDGKS